MATLYQLDRWILASWLSIVRLLSRHPRSIYTTFSGHYTSSPFVVLSIYWTDSYSPFPLFNYLYTIPILYGLYTDFRVASTLLLLCLFVFMSRTLLVYINTDQMYLDTLGIDPHSLDLKVPHVRSPRLLLTNFLLTRANAGPSLCNTMIGVA